MLHVHLPKPVEKSNHFTPSPNTKTQNTIKKLQTKLKNENIVVTSADKGNSIVLLHKDNYSLKVQDFIKKENAKPTRDPTNNLDKEVRNFLKNEGSELFQDTKFLINKNPHAPRLYGTVKIHKANDTLPIVDVPIRPVVSSYTSPVYLLEKELVKMFNNHVQWKPTYSIKNRLELINEIQNIECNSNSILLSLDVNSLFSKVNIPTAIDKISNIIDNYSTLSDGEKLAFVNALKLCTKFNYFKFNDITYRQNEGCAMGSPLSPLLAEIFMNDFEDILFASNSPLLQYIVTYKRYVDDIFIIWNNVDSNVDEIISLCQLY